MELTPEFDEGVEFAVVEGLALPAWQTASPCQGLAVPKGPLGTASGSAQASLAPSEQLPVGDQNLVLVTKFGLDVAMPVNLYGSHCLMRRGEISVRDPPFFPSPSSCSQHVSHELWAMIFKQMWSHQSPPSFPIIGRKALPGSMG